MLAARTFCVLTPDVHLTWLIDREAVRIVNAQMLGEACNLVFRDDGHCNLKSHNLFRKKDFDLELVAGVRMRRFQGDGVKFLLVSEVERIRLAYFFDVNLPVCSSAMDSLPHQISDDATARVVLENSRSLKVDSPQIY